MGITGLGYFGAGATSLSDWSEFGTKLLGMQAIERSRTSLALRMDDRKQRLLIDEETVDAPRFFGWEVADAAALDRFAAHLESWRVPFRREPRTLADQRMVADLVSFSDPVGNRLEVFHGAAIDDTPFVPGRNISGFRTGPLGLGHAVLTVKNVDEVMPFYTDVLGFRLSDYSLRPFKAFFFHINNRHHSLAMVETGLNGLHHLMVELFTLDDVGQAYDLAQADPERVAVTLGRHTNDFMTSFYARSPSKFMVEYGWGGRDIEPTTWQPFECEYGPSLWGHDRSWLSPEKRQEARELRVKAATEGHREPVQVMAGNYQLARGVCPWWDNAVRSE
jgi:2,3-dihydroxybiphenyl 1,2-dioxygenase